MLAPLLRAAARRRSHASLFSAAAASDAGQPTHSTHPHALAPGELAPGVTAADVAARRAALVDAAGLPPGGVALLPAAPRTFVAGVIPHPYRPDADFAHFTGVTQPGCVAAIVAGAGGDGGRGRARMVLFVPDGDARVAAWDGAPLTPAAAVAVFGADDAYPMSELDTRLAPLLAAAPAVAVDGDRPADPALARCAPLAAAVAARKAVPLRRAAHAVRWAKAPAELALMRASARLAARGMTAAMAVSGGGGGPAVQLAGGGSVRAPRTEAGLAAAFDFTVRCGGADRLAYPPVVAAGVDALTIHYSRNDKLLKAGEIVLMDAGCETWGYASDVTRTWPAAGGPFPPAAADVYDAVVSVHRRVLAAARPGASLAELHATAVAALTDATAQLAGTPASPAAMRTIYPHSIGHWLGRDTHDCGTVPPSTRLRPGVVLALEPGLYFPTDFPHAGLAGIGVRVEDVVAITEAGCDVLSRDAPLERGDVEAAVGAAGDAAVAAAAV